MVNRDYHFLQYKMIIRNGDANWRVRRNRFYKVNIFYNIILVGFAIVGVNYHKFILAATRNFSFVFTTTTGFIGMIEAYRSKFSAAIMEVDYKANTANHIEGYKTVYFNVAHMNKPYSKYIVFSWLNFRWIRDLLVKNLFIIVKT